MLSSPRARPPQTPVEPYPDLRAALLWTLLAVLCAAAIGALFVGLGTLAAVGIGQAFGIGIVATFAARRVPEPQAERIGLRGIELRQLPLLLAVVPAVLLASELDNFAWDAARLLPPAELAAPDAGPVDSDDSDGSDAGAGSESESGETGPSPGDARERGADDAETPPPESGAQEGESPASEGSDPESAASEAEALLAEPLIDPDDPWSLLQAVIILIGISPVVEEFLFRGVIQQGLVARYGLHRGIAFVALLSAVLRPTSLDGIVRFAAGMLAHFGLGWLLGMLRVATGSVLAPILVASAWAAVGLAALALEERMPLPGLNVEGTHLPWVLSLGSAALVTWAAAMLHHDARERHAEEGAAPPPDPSQRVGRGGWDGED